MLQPIVIDVIVAAGSDKSTDIDLSKSKSLLDSVDNIEGTNDGGWAVSQRQNKWEQVICSSIMPCFNDCMVK